MCRYISVEFYTVLYLALNFSHKHQNFYSYTVHLIKNNINNINNIK